MLVWAEYCGFVGVDFFHSYDESSFLGLQALTAVRGCQSGSTSLVDEGTKTRQMQVQHEG